MNHEQIIHAWKDSSYRNTLSAEELAQLPSHPAGEILSEVELDSVTGGKHYTTDTAAFNVLGNVCSPVTINRSGSYFQDVAIGRDFTYSPDCSTNTYNVTTTITNNIGNTTF